ncbi:MAG: hypothetical protein IJA12_02855 [Oscillospiraceae bacterium]|nr:hypothetical protein [Oscillospiraceae bacterium]
MSGSMITGAITAAAGLAAAATIFIIQNKTSLIVMGTFLTQFQLLIIVLISVSKHELHGMFPLMLASMAMGGIYLNKRNLIAHWIVMDIAVVVGMFMGDLFYSGVGMGFLIKGIACINVGAYLILYLVSFSINRSLFIWTLRKVYSSCCFKLACAFFTTS